MILSICYCLLRYLKLRRSIMGSLIFYVTYKCNLRCSYCFGCQKYNISMEPPIAYAAIDKVLSNNDKINKFSFFGGEPLMEFDRIVNITDYIVEVSKRKGIMYKFGITTNGTIGDEKIFRFLAKNKFRVTLSIDGNEQSQDTERKTICGDGSFRLLEERLDNWVMLQNHSRVFINMVITPNNLRYLAKSIKYLFFKGFRFFNPEIEFYAEWKEQDFKILEREYQRITEFYLDVAKKGQMIGINGFKYGVYSHKLSESSKNIIGCSAGGKRLVVSPEGKYYSCYRFVGFDEIKDFTIGNIETDVLEQKRTDLIQIMREQSNDFSAVCAECNIGRCRISCLAYYYMTPADIKWKYCNINKILARANCDYFTKINKL